MLQENQQASSLLPLHPRAFCRLAAALLVGHGSLFAGSGAQAKDILTTSSEIELKTSGAVALVVNPVAPEPYYRGVRFARAGMVRSLKVQDVEFFHEMGNPRKPAHHDHVAGLSEEFDLSGPASYASAEVGGEFLKIGVGVLRKPSVEAYKFSRNYELVRPANIQLVSATPEQVIFEEQAATSDGQYGYWMRVTVRIFPMGLEVERRLRNAGSLAWTTEHYNHHFLHPGLHGVEAGTELLLSPSMTPSQPARELSGLNISPERICFSAAPEKGFYVEWTYEPPASGAGWILLRPDGWKLTMRNSAEIFRGALWGHRGVISPELFFRISLKAGEEAAWVQSYHVEMAGGVGAADSKPRSRN